MPETMIRGRPEMTSLINGMGISQKVGQPKNEEEFIAKEDKRKQAQDLVLSTIQFYCGNFTRLHTIKHKDPNKGGWIR